MDKDSTFNVWNKIRNSYKILQNEKLFALLDMLKRFYSRFNVNSANRVKL
jgi:CRISPR/Cas system CSM-associated protein Csm5 (group 7 of RAMP superfamily)